MGYGPAALKVVEDLLASRVHYGPLRMLELGAQEINYDVLPSTIFGLIYRLNRDFNQPEEIVRQLPGCFVAPVFRAANVQYSCIDLFEADGVLQLDLNVSPLPAEHHGKYDVVTNMGTTEHIFNQAGAFEAIHNATKVGGVMFHAVPGNGLFNHGLIKYEPKLFLYLAHANNYEVLRWKVVQGGPDYMPLMDEIPGSESWLGADISKSLLTFLLRKREDTPFVQPSDVDLRYVPSDFPQSLRNSVTPSTPAKPAIRSRVEPAPDLKTRLAPADDGPAVDLPLPRFVHFLERIEAHCGSMGIGIEPYALAASMLSADFYGYLSDIEFSSTAVARHALDEMVAKAATHMSMPPEGLCCSVNLGLSFLGTGWGKAGGDVHARQPRHFRALGPGGRSRVFVRLPEGRDYRMNLLLYDVSPHDSIERLQLKPATDGKLDVVGDDFWYRSWLSKEAIARQSGLISIDVSAGETDKVILQKIVFEPV